MARKAAAVPASKAEIGTIGYSGVDIAQNAVRPLLEGLRKLMQVDA